jgi:hypothetical protein
LDACLVELDGFNPFGEHKGDEKPTALVELE